MTRAATVDEYSRRCETIGRLVQITTSTKSFSGRAIALTDDGRLVVEHDGKSYRLEAADVIHLREA